MGAMKRIENEANRVEEVAKRGDATGAWRLAVLALASRDPLVRSTGCGLLVRLPILNSAYDEPARAVLEGRIVQGGDLDDVDKLVMLMYYSMLDRIKIALGPFTRAEAFVRAAEAAGSLPVACRAFCEAQAASPEIGRKFAAFPILLLAAKMGAGDRKWSIEVSRRLRASAHKSDERILAVLYEALSGYTLEGPSHP